MIGNKRVIASEEEYLAWEQYCREIGYLPRQLSEEEVTIIVERARSGDEEARSRLVESLLKYVLHLGVKYAIAARKMVRFDADTLTPDVLDLVQAGNLAICERLNVALERPNPIGYLRLIAKGAILRYSKENLCAIRVPHTSYDVRGCRAPSLVSLDKLQMERKRVPVAEPLSGSSSSFVYRLLADGCSIDEIAEKVGWSADEMRTRLKKVRDKLRYNNSLTLREAVEDVCRNVVESPLTPVISILTAPGPQDEWKAMRKKLLSFLRDHPGVSVSAAANQLGVCHDTAWTWVRQFKADGVILA